MKLRLNKSDFTAERMLYAVVMGLGLLVRSISRNHSTAIARFLGDIGYSVFKIRRKLVTENLALVFPEKSAADISAVARQVYRNQAENIIEMLRLPMIATVEDAARLVDMDTRELFAQTRDQHKGAVVVSAHFGNWELFALCAGLLVSPLMVVVKRLKNQDIDRQINAWRGMHGNRVVYTWKALREGMRTLKNGGIVSLLADQSSQKGQFFLDFMGRKAPVSLGPAFLALKAGVPLFVCMCRRTGDGRYIVETEEIATGDLGTEKADAEELARRYTKVFERFIYRYPEEWFWLHNRWKRSELR